jgi:SNF2 family DNA or RNA helicase
MKYNPHEYQIKAYNWIIDHPKCGLFLAMGMGKTVVTMTALVDLIATGDIERVLVIAPKRVAEDTWSREHQKWNHLSSLRISKALGNVKQRTAALKIDADIYITNRENVMWLVESGLWDFDCVVIDELSSFKSSASKRFRTLRKVIPTCKRVIGLTGTPAPQGYIDLWSELYLLDQGARLGRTLTEYRNSYFKNMSRDPSYRIDVLVKGAEKVINKKISDICMSMTAEDYLKMPKRIDNMIPVVLSEKERSVYLEMEKKQFLEFSDDKEISVTSAASLTGKLLQLANGFIYDEDKTAHLIHERKIEALEEIIDSNPHEPIMVFYYYQADLMQLRKHFPKGRVLDTSDDISAWNKGKIPLLFAHPMSMGHGLNLQDGGHIIVWYSLVFSLEAYQQACARLMRQGQKSSTVIIHHLVTQGSVDEQVIKALHNKATTQASLIDALKERGRKWKNSI